MNETLNNLLASIRQWVAKLTPKQRSFLGMAIGGAAITAVAATLIGQQDPYQVIYSELQPEEARAVIKKLGEEKIPHLLSGDETSVSVPGSMVARARMDLAKAGLPGQNVVGFEKFDSATLGMSSYVQRIQYIRAVQGELTRSVQQLSAVKRARVHISIPPKKTFLEEEEAPKASVILELKRGMKPSKGEINGIAHLVASAVEGLKVTNVSIVDTQGNFLHRPEDAGSTTAMSGALLETQRSLEQEYERRVEEILTPVVGLGKVRAKVAAEMDPSRVNTTEESFDSEKAAVRNTVKNEEVTHGSKPNPVGIAGSRSNLPGAEAANPTVPMANTSSEKNVQNTTYSIPRKVQVTDKPGGSLKRLTVAVIVDGYYTTVNGTETFSPRSDEELRRLQDLVANSVGFDDQRRDSITVSCLPFRSSELPAEDAKPEVVWWKSPSNLRLGAILLTAVLSFLGLMWFLSRRARQISSVETGVGALPRTVAEIEAQSSALAGAGAGKPTLGDKSPTQDPEPVEKVEESELRLRIIDRLSATPKKGLSVVEEWLEAPEAPKPVENQKWPLPRAV